MQPNALKTCHWGVCADWMINLKTWPHPQWLHGSHGAQYGKGRQHSARTVYKPHRYRRLNQVWDWLSTSIVTNFDASITGDELYSAIQLPSVRLVAAWHVACVLYYSTRLFIHGITSAKRTRVVRPAVLDGESSTQLLMYSGVRYSTYLPTLRPWIFS